MTEPLPAFESPEGARVVIDGRTYDWFRSNGYLGLAGDPEVIRAACEATTRYGLRLRDRRPIGCHPCIVELERRAAEFCGAPAVAYVGSGYTAGGALLAALRDDYDRIFLDEDAHDSSVDGAAVSGRPVVRFAHADPEALAGALARHLRPRERPLVLTDGIFPISGDIAPGRAYRDCLQRHEGGLLVFDDAHALGVLGERGRGTAEHFGLSGPGIRSFASLSKAFSAYGGVIPGERALAEAVATRAGAARAASKPPPGIIAAAARALEIAAARPELRARLRGNVAALRAGLRALGLAVDPHSPSPIICLEARRGLEIHRVCRSLLDESIAVFALEGGYAGVPPGGALVITVFATHTPDQLGRLLAALARHL